LCGAVPLDVLEELVKEYIEKVKNGSDVSGERGETEEGESTSTTTKETEKLPVMTFANWCKCCIVPGNCQL
jgi:hypothetical protein